MRHSTVTCHCCGKIMVPRTTYSRGLLGYSPTSSHCPFCLSDNWHGGNPSLHERIFWLMGFGRSSCMRHGGCFVVQAAMAGWYRRCISMAHPTD